jgi:hypothetical protein
MLKKLSCWLCTILCTVKINLCIHIPQKILSQKMVTDILKNPTDVDSAFQKLCPSENFQENL